MPIDSRETTVRGKDGQLAPASALVTIEDHAGDPELMRENLRQMALITARLEDRDLGSAVSEIEIRARADELPVGYTWEVGGQYDSQRKAFRELLLVSGIATALVFLVLVVQFRAFTASAIILAAAPLSLGGAFGLLLLTGTDLNVSSAMGLILLVGLVVKNGIVLLDFAEMRHDEGMPMADAILAAARVRLRPILMTTLVHAVRPAAAGARTRRRRRTAEAAGARRHRRPEPVHADHLVPGAHCLPRARQSVEVARVSQLSSHR